MTIKFQHHDIISEEKISELTNKKLASRICNFYCILTLIQRFPFVNMVSLRVFCSLITTGHFNDSSFFPKNERNVARYKYHFSWHQHHWQCTKFKWNFHHLFFEVPPNHEPLSCPDVNNTAAVHFHFVHNLWVLHVHVCKPVRCKADMYATLQHSHSNFKFTNSWYLPFISLSF